MKIIRKILLGIGILVVVLAGIGFLLPNSAQLERSIVINAPVDDVFKTVNDIREFNKWSPWAKIDPKAKYEFEGPHTGVGAIMIWKSDHPNVGSGKQEIVKSDMNKRVETSLDFGTEGTATAYYRLQEQDGGTNTTWGFNTKFGYNIIARYFGLMFDSMIGPDYETGLANLKTLLENKAQSPVM